MRKSRAAVGVSALVLLAAAAVAGCVESREEIPDSENAPEDTESEPDDDETDPGSDEPVCGDDIAEQPEECDDGNTDPTDGCIDCVDATCGDSFVWSGVEACDDGVNDGSYEGCAPDCLALGPGCGDGEVYAGEAADGGVYEECDDGDAESTDECIDCAAATCGDGFVWAGEEACDDGVNDGAYAGCAPGCDALGPHCGDGEVNGPEACDDGTNDGSYDGCATDCLALGPTCGDGEVYAGEAADGGVYEECDDGDGEVGDGCTEACTEETCGDGMVGWSRPRDGYEEGFALLPWATGTAVGWNGPFALTSAGVATPHGGEQMAMSASPASGFTDNRAYLQLVVDVVGASQTCFWYTVDDLFFSTFRFSVNGSAALELTGVPGGAPWTEQCADVPSGDDTVLLWEYEQSWMEDGAALYLDDVVLPLVQEECDDGDVESGDGCSAVCGAE